MTNGLAIRVINSISVLHAEWHISIFAILPKNVACGKAYLNICHLAGVSYEIC